VPGKRPPLLDNLLGCLDAPSAGTLRLFLNRSSAGFNGNSENTPSRRDQIGFVFQHFGLLPDLTVAEKRRPAAFFLRDAPAPKIGCQNEGQKSAAWKHSFANTARHELSGGEIARGVGEIRFAP